MNQEPEYKTVKNPFESAPITPPTEDKIEETIQLINDILELPQIDLLKNSAVKEGYNESVDILMEDKRDIKDTNIERLKTVQARAIAMLAVDYLNGECSQKVLVGVPLNGVDYSNRIDEFKGIVFDK